MNYDPKKLKYGDKVIVTNPILGHRWADGMVFTVKETFFVPSRSTSKFRCTIACEDVNTWFHAREVEPYTELNAEHFCPISIEDLESILFGRC